MLTMAIIKKAKIAPYLCDLTCRKPYFAYLKRSAVVAGKRKEKSPLSDGREP
jgi:hypothetical protein